MRTDELLGIAHEAVDLAARMMVTERAGDLTYKTDRDYASELDFRIERAIRGFLAERTPGIGFVGEEEGTVGDTERSWCLDPIDGTVNFVRGLPLCAVSLALIEGDRPVLGVIDMPLLQERYAAARGHGATLNGQPIRVSETNTLAKAIVSIGDYATGEGSEAKNVDRLAITTRLANEVLRLRMLGTAATDLAWLAAGRIDALIMLSNKPWDVSAGVIIAQEAGAVLHDADGQEYTLRSRSLVASTPAITAAVAAVARPRRETRAHLSEEHYGLTPAPSILLTHTDCVLLDFDGPVTRLLPPPRNAELTDRVRAAIPSGTAIPEEIQRTTDHLHVLKWAATVGPQTLSAVEDAAIRLETEAARQSTVTDGTREFLTQCAERGTPIAIVSNNAAEAITEFLTLHDLDRYITHIVGRPYRHPEHMKPATTIIDQALTLTGAEATRSVLIGDSVSDITVAQHVGTESIGLAASATKMTTLDQAGTIVTNMHQLQIAKPA